MKKNILLSIVIPAYKAEKYLSRCLESILQQNENALGYEIIVVDDGSPDQCGMIADSYAKAFENIRVFHQRNGG